MKTDTIVVVAVLVAVIGLPTLWVYAHVSSCGWKGLFVECRIMDCPK